MQKPGATIKVSNTVTRMFMDKNAQLLSLLTYVKENERDDKALSKQKVVDYMNEKDLSSKVTTITMINHLLQEGVLVDDSNRSYQSVLKVNPNYDLSGLVDQILYSEFTELNEKLKPFKKFTGRKPKLKHYVKE
jgi:hypothetical protein